MKSRKIHGALHAVGPGDGPTTCGLAKEKHAKKAMAKVCETRQGKRCSRRPFPGPTGPLPRRRDTIEPHQQRSKRMQQKNLDIYGDAPIPWSRALEQLQDDSAKKSYWLATVRPDGRPHVAAVGALWLDGTFYFTSGEGTRKSRNLDTNPNCVISVSLPDLDLVVEGTATRVTDGATL